MTLRGIVSPRISGRSVALSTTYEDYEPQSGSGTSRSYTMSIGAQNANKYLIMGAYIFDNSTGISTMNSLTAQPGGSGPTTAFSKLGSVNFNINDRSELSYWLSNAAIPDADATALFDAQFNSSIGTCEMFLHSTIAPAGVVINGLMQSDVSGDPMEVNVDVPAGGSAFMLARATGPFAFTGVNEDAEQGSFATGHVDLATEDLARLLSVDHGGGTIAALGMALKPDI